MKQRNRRIEQRVQVYDISRNRETLTPWVGQTSTFHGYPLNPFAQINEQKVVANPNLTLDGYRRVIGIT